MSTALPVADGPLEGSVVVPGSKSETNRAIVLAALSNGPSRVEGALHSRDSQLMINALRALGAKIHVDGSTVHVTPSPVRGSAQIDCGLAGTVMRFVPAVALLGDATVSFIGDPHASERPMQGLLDGLRALGATVDGNQLPFTVTPAEAQGGEISVDASASSQFVSALLLVGAHLHGGLTIRHKGASLPSRPHIAMTLSMLRARGVDAREVDERTWGVAEGPIGALDTRIEPDLTNAAVFLAAAAVASGAVSVPMWPRETTQPGAAFLDVARSMGCQVELCDDVVTLSGDGHLTSPGRIDLHSASELTPVVAALAALAEGTTTITGVAHIRGHETNRIAAIAEQLQRVGIAVEELEDGLRITGGSPKPLEFDTYADHRMVHFAALLGLRAKGSSVNDMECVSKTMPDFPQMWAELQ
ncbi:3-phosphoshikimate 1-carboxyvinyltransferase [uncultured Tessaracoccus sp.]|uniref:3-phosphoshikimate 1-carboxyvinyltransferase n=1 Tax=uncultured Tessaracoccus sp. TaxID=905023 RepID=UPI002601DD93|nr:3-phosphoshikimate 1-carboxyvinyltransferase [uncultured Tessaracoccus sp.]